MKLRGKKILKLVDRYAGIPLLFLIGFFKIRRKLPEQINNIGILLTPAIGDTILCQALLKDIKKTSPSTRITLFADSSITEVCNLIGFSDEIVEINLSDIIQTIKTIRLKNFDIFIDCAQWSKTMALISFFSDSKYLIGFKTKGQGLHFIFDTAIEHLNTVHEIYNFKNLNFFSPSKTELPLIKIEEEVGKISNRVVLHTVPGGYRSYLKEWSNENWRKIIFYLIENKFEIYLTGSKSDIIKIDNLIKDINGKIFNVAGKLNIQDTAKLLNSSVLVISVNTGIMHLASALNCNLIALHGPTNAKRWGPLNNNSVSIQSNYHCSPCLNLGFEYNCNDDTGECMNAIELETVINEINKFLQLS